MDDISTTLRLDVWKASENGYYTSSSLPIALEDVLFFGKDNEFVNRKDGGFKKFTPQYYLRTRSDYYRLPKRSYDMLVAAFKGKTKCTYDPIFAMKRTRHGQASRSATNTRYTVKDSRLNV